MLLSEDRLSMDMGDDNVMFFSDFDYKDFIVEEPASVEPFTARNSLRSRNV